MGSYRISRAHVSGLFERVRGRHPNCHRSELRRGDGGSFLPWLIGAVRYGEVAEEKGQTSANTTKHSKHNRSRRQLEGTRVGLEEGQGDKTRKRERERKAYAHVSGRGEAWKTAKRIGMGRRAETNRHSMAKPASSSSTAGIQGHMESWTHGNYRVKKQGGKGTKEKGSCHGGSREKENPNFNLRRKVLTIDTAGALLDWDWAS